MNEYVYEITYYALGGGECIYSVAAFDVKEAIEKFYERIKDKKIISEVCKVERKSFYLRSKGE